MHELAILTKFRRNELTSERPYEMQHDRLAEGEGTRYIKVNEMDWWTRRYKRELKYIHSAVRTFQRNSEQKRAKLENRQVAYASSEFGREDLVSLHSIEYSQAIPIPKRKWAGIQQRGYGTKRHMQREVLYGAQIDHGRRYRLCDGWMRGLASSGPAVPTAACCR